MSDIKYNDFKFHVCQNFEIISDSDKNIFKVNVIAVSNSFGESQPIMFNY